MGFKGQVFLSHGKSNSRGILTAYFRTETFSVKKQQIEKDIGILIHDVFNNDSGYILINLYHAIIEKEQIDILSNLFEPPEEFDANSKR